MFYNLFIKNRAAAGAGAQYVRTIEAATDDDVKIVLVDILREHTHACVSVHFSSGESIRHIVGHTLLAMIEAPESSPFRLIYAKAHGFMTQEQAEADIARHSK